MSGDATSSATGALLAEATERLLAAHCGDVVMRAARAGIWPEDAWNAAQAQGLTLALVQGEQGFGVAPEAGLALVSLLGRHAVPLPLAETMIGNALLARAGLPVGEGVLALVPEGIALADGHARGVGERIAWGRNAAALLVEDGGRIGLVTGGFAATGLAANCAAMPRDRLRVDAPARTAAVPGLSLLEAGALVRALTSAGAMQSLVAMTVTHITERVQFGRPLSAFQAVQHALARLASEAAAAAAAADLAADAYARGSPDARIAIAAARARISDAAGIAIGIAHQLHGAIGFTEEHRLHWFTTALWAWRDEFGSAAYWTRELGSAALKWSKSAYWPAITAL